MEKEMEKKLERIEKLEEKAKGAREKGLYVIVQECEKEIKQLEEEIKEERFKQTAMRNMPWD